MEVYLKRRPEIKLLASIMIRKVNNNFASVCVFLRSLIESSEVAVKVNNQCLVRQIIIATEAGLLC